MRIELPQSSTFKTTTGHRIKHYSRVPAHHKSSASEANGNQVWPIIQRNRHRCCPILRHKSCPAYPNPPSIPLSGNNRFRSRFQDFHPPSHHLSIVSCIAYMTITRRLYPICESCTRTVVQNGHPTHLSALYYWHTAGVGWIAAEMAICIYERRGTDHLQR